MEHVTTLTPVVKYATTPADRRAARRLVSHYQLSSASKQFVRKNLFEKWEKCLFTRLAYKVSEGRINEVTLLPPKACWSDRMDFCHIHGSQRREKSGASQPARPDRQREHREPSRQRNRVIGWLKDDGDSWLTEVLFPQNRDNSGPKLEGKENLWVWNGLSLTSCMGHNFFFNTVS